MKNKLALCMFANSSGVNTSHLDIPSGGSGVTGSGGTSSGGTGSGGSSSSSGGGGGGSSSGSSIVSWGGSGGDGGGDDGHMMQEEHSPTQMYPMVDSLLVMPLPSIRRVCNASNSTNQLPIMHPTNPSCISCHIPQPEQPAFQKLLQQINLLRKSATCVVLLVTQHICVRSVMIDIFATFACMIIVGLSLET